MPALVALVAGVLLVATAGGASAQTVTSDPNPSPTPGYVGCGGNSTIRDVTADFTCGNQRTFYFGSITRTVIAISTFHADGTASTTFTLTGGVAPATLHLRIVSHSGVSSSNAPAIDEANGDMLVGTKGPVTLNYRFDCGQVDIKAILTGNGQSAGRISGPYLCKAQPAPTTTAPTTTTGTTLPGQTTVTPSTALTQTVVTVARGQIPATGSNTVAALLVVTVLVLAGFGIIILARRNPAR
jgi:hypothetical protein